MRRILIALVGLSLGCIAGGRPVVERDDRLVREIARQERWAQQALERRPAPDELDRIRSSDFDAVAKGRKELQRLIAGADRGTWIREAVAGDDDPELHADFDRAGALRKDALAAADELAGALAEASGGLTMSDLRPGLEAVRKAQASEDRLMRMPVAPGRNKLGAAPLPVPRPFLDAMARLAQEDPAAAKEIDRLSPDDATKVRAKKAELDLKREEEKKNAPPVPATPPPSEGTEAPAPSDTLNISNDTAALISKKGPPRSITLRPDGLFALHYDDADYLVDPEGKQVRTEPAEKK